MLALELQLLQALATLGVGQLHQAVTVEPQQIEQHQRHRLALCQLTHGGLAAQVHAVLKRLKAGPSVLIEGDDLAVEDRLVGAERPVQRAQLGIRARHVVFVSAEQVDTPRL